MSERGWSGYSPADVSAYALRLGDDALVLAQRLVEWSSRAPALEEDIALSNIALDLLGQARSLLGYAGEADGSERSEDDLAYLRSEGELTNVQLVEQPNGDFAWTMARQLFFSTYQLALYRRLAASADETLAAVAAKAAKEVDYHRDHATTWTLRLGDGTGESHRRMQAALDQLWPFTHELFEADGLTERLADSRVAVDPASLQPEWDDHVGSTLAAATLSRPEGNWRPGGGRQGHHSEHLGYLLAEMQHLHRSHPGARW
ncbi:MAG: 1,2-phenylacetyl-CoA epoxidase subunit PaaC [Acidimicrobiia bacterium]